jgi:hypothetical protein
LDRISPLAAANSEEISPKFQGWKEGILLISRYIT